MTTSLIKLCLLSNSWFNSSTTHMYLNNCDQIKRKQTIDWVWIDVVGVASIILVTNSKIDEPRVSALSGRLQSSRRWVCVLIKPAMLWVFFRTLRVSTAEALRHAIRFNTGSRGLLLCFSWLSKLFLLSLQAHTEEEGIEKRKVRRVGMNQQC